MALPPFSILTATPGDSDVVSQYPINERSTRDIIQSWLLTNHDTNGNHNKIIMPYQGSAPATPAASLIAVYADVNGRLKIVYSDATVGFVGLPPGAVIYTASSSTPVGYLIADFSAVSRSVYADLFAQIGVTYGPGDGSTTFNLPDIKGRVIAGEDASAGRLTSTYFGTTAILAAVGGLESQTLSLAQLPSITSVNAAQAISVTSTISSIAKDPDGPLSSNASGGSQHQLASTSTIGSVISTGSNSISVTSSGTSGNPHRTVQPTIILRALIKT